MGVEVREILSPERRDETSMFRQGGSCYRQVGGRRYQGLPELEGAISAGLGAQPGRRRLASGRRRAGRAAQTRH